MDADFTPDQVAWLDERAPLEGLDRAGLLRLVVEYAMVTMPPGWRLDTDFHTRWRKAEAEARTVARRLAQIDIEQPGYVDRLATLPPQQQTAKIRDEVYQDAIGAYIPDWPLSSPYVAVPVAGGDSAALAKIRF